MDGRIVVAPDVCNGQPVIRGTRISVQSILEYLAAGDSHADILEEFSSLVDEDIAACLSFASKLAGSRFSLEAVAG